MLSSCRGGPEARKVQFGISRWEGSLPLFFCPLREALVGLSLQTVETGSFGLCLLVEQVVAELPGCCLWAICHLPGDHPVAAEDRKGT